MKEGLTMLRSEYINPQFQRDNWVCLNGEWECGFMPAKRGFKFTDNENAALEIKSKAVFDRKITVPFCIESKLSGIGYTGFVNMIWYRKKVDIRKGDSRVFLNIGAADNLTTVIVNNKTACRHKGGYTPIKADITELVCDGENEIFILCEDDVKNPFVISGKQSDKRNSHGCLYTRTTGIWQSVYLEYTPKQYIKNFKIYPDADACSVTVMLELCGSASLSAEAFYEGAEVGKAFQSSAVGCAVLHLPLSQKQLWEPGKGRLYDLELKFGDDTVHSYFGLRSVRLDGYRFLINNKSVFQRLVLDQGFYRDGIYTAKDDEEIKKDIELSMAVGFNGARLHQKTFEPRFLYYCDKMGYLVWGEYGNWGLNHSSPKSVDAFLSEWKEVLDRDFNHPSIIGWCPFNETWDYNGKRQYDPLLATVYDYTKVCDITRPCIDTSGNYHVKTDIYDVHDYNCNFEEFKNNYDRLMTEGVLHDHIGSSGRQQYGGQPTFISEYGGIKWEGDSNIESWGYGNDVKTPEEFADRYCGLTDAIVANSRMFGFCYTQLYDIEQEQNGLYTYDRKRKFDDEIYGRIYASNTQKAEIEK